MSADELRAISPLIVLGAAALVALLGITIRRSHRFSALACVVGLALAMASLFLRGSAPPPGPLLVADDFAVVYTALVLTASFAVAVLASGYMARRQRPEELYVLLLVATLGAVVLVWSGHLVSLFLGLETLSVSLYSLIGYTRTGPRSVEASIKYLILAAASSAILLFGMALVYAELGTMVIIEMGPALAVASGRTLVVPGVALMVTGIGFKLALVPFHMWTPDVYEGAPAPVTALVATVSKGAVVALFVRLAWALGAAGQAALLVAFGIVAAASMLAGNLLALRQDNLKRLLAYSSIAHLGYVLTAILAGGPGAIEAVSIYVTAYFVTILAAFGVVTVLSGPDGDADRLEEYQGLVWRRPFVAMVLVLSLLSLAGIPLTAGFIAKFAVIFAGVRSGLWTLLAVLVISSAIGLYYYLRVVVVMFAAAPAASAVAPPVPQSSRVLLLCLALILVWLGVYPVPLQGIAWTAASSLARESPPVTTPLGPATARRP
ncbi:MAG: NADH-quinone oxidoreductase subunit N [Deltaproteobacteria bacterium]|nr:NADH-quinone oxidoreductase subunit N [Deltaproteobacteria bacterium]